MVKINVIKGGASPQAISTGHRPKETKIRLSPEMAESLMSTAIQVVSLVVMGIVSVVLKQNLFPAE